MQPLQNVDVSTMYNGIRLSSPWPPNHVDLSDRTPKEVPYLTNPPAIIPIDIGRQLFVDDFLIEQTTLLRTFHHAQKYEGNPILSPATSTEKEERAAAWTNYKGSHIATLFNDGCWWDPRDKVFKLFYMTGWHGGTALAYSRDGLHWERPDLGTGTNAPNQILPEPYGVERNGSTVWLDLLSDAERYKMFVYHQETARQRIYTSPDGIHWERRGDAVDGVGDNTSMFYNPFRKKWVYSIRTNVKTRNPLDVDARCRGYRECDDLVAGIARSKDEMVPWAGADDWDLPDPMVTRLMPQSADASMRKDYGALPQLYNVDAIAYESLMLGVFNIHYGPENHVSMSLGMPKVTKLQLAYSRDGFHWHRPDRTPFISPTGKLGDWDRGYLHPASSVCAIVGDKLYFYYGAFSGLGDATHRGWVTGGSIGVAFLRRDGFASMDADDRGGTLTTRVVTFNGKHFFVNADAGKGELRVEILDQEGNVITPFSKDHCHPVVTDSTKQDVSWSGAADLSALSGKPVRFRFHLSRGELYAFWVSPERGGASQGYIAAGGPEFDGPVDADRA